MDRTYRREKKRRIDEMMKEIEREADAEWEAGNYAEEIRLPPGISKFGWPRVLDDDDDSSSDTTFAAVGAASNVEATMEPASKIMRLGGGVTSETVRHMAQQSASSTVAPSAPRNASMNPGKPLVPLKTSLTVTTTPMPSSKPARPPLPPNPTVTLSITSKSSSKPEKPPLPSKPTITLSTTLKPPPKPGFAASQKSLSQTLLPFTDSSSSSIQTAVLPNPPTTPFPSSSTLPSTKAVPESSLASVDPSSIQTAILQVLGVVKQIHDTQKLQVEDSKRLEAKVDALASRMANLEEQVKHFSTKETSTGSERPTVVEIKMEKLSSVEELHKFDNELGSNKEFFNAIALWMENTIIAEDMETRIRKALDLLFDRKLFSKTSENQPRPHIFFAKCSNVHKLLRAIGRGSRPQSPAEQIVINQSIQKMCNESSSS